MINKNSKQKKNDMYDDITNKSILDMNKYGRHSFKFSND